MENFGYGVGKGQDAGVPTAAQVGWGEQKEWRDSVK